MGYRIKKYIEHENNLSPNKMCSEVYIVHVLFAYVYMIPYAYILEDRVTIPLNGNKKLGL